jgi:hypothetical protein
MNAARPPCPLARPSRADFDLLLRHGVPPMALAGDEPLWVARGYKARDDRFEPEPSAERWYAFEVRGVDDIMFWHLASGDVASWSGRAFALGEEVIDRAATCSFGQALNVFATPLDWLQGQRDGIVVLPGCWPSAFDRLRDAARIAVAEEVLPLYRRFMKPARMPELFVIPARRRTT